MDIGILFFLTMISLFIFFQKGKIIFYLVFYNDWLYMEIDLKIFLNIVVVKEAGYKILFMQNSSRLQQVKILDKNRAIKWVEVDNKLKNKEKGKEEF